MQYKKRKNTYFAAANGYTGFRSYFDEIFDSARYERVFILKGGPGTGKSSLLKRVEGRGASLGFQTEAILCSSDPDSYDGVILMHKERCVALLDGTAPHERDAVIPGAVDELICLGENWDTEHLLTHRGTILSLAKRKREAYQSAYQHLMQSSVFDSKIKAEYNTRAINEEIKTVAEGLFDRLRDLPRGDEKHRLITSFSRHGLLRLEGIFSSASTVIRLLGEPRICHGALTHLASLCHTVGLEMILFPTVLDPTLGEAIYFPAAHLLIHATDTVSEGEETILLLAEAPRSDAIAVAEEYRVGALSLAKEALSEAAEAHLSLEQIYRSAMDFQKNDALTDALAERIQKILS